MSYLTHVLAATRAKLHTHANPGECVLYMFSLSIP